MNLRFIKQTFLILLLLPTMVFAHETRLTPDFTTEEYGANVAINNEGNSILVLDKTKGVIVYVQENGKWVQQSYTLSASSNKNLKMSVDGNYAAITANGSGKAHIYIWDTGENFWRFNREVQLPTSSPTIKLSSYKMAMQYSGKIDIQKYYYTTLSGSVGSAEYLNGPFDFKGDLIAATSYGSSKSATYVYRNYNFEAELPHASLVSTDGSAIAINQPNTLKIEIYRHDSSVNENGGWYKSEEIPLKDYSSNATQASNIILKSNKLYISSQGNLDGEYGYHSEHNIIHEYTYDGVEWQLSKEIMPANFSASSSSFGSSFAVSNDILVAGDYLANPILPYNHTQPIKREGAVYVFDLNEDKEVDLSLDISSPVEEQIIGNTATYQFHISNNSNNIAANTIFESDINSNKYLDKIYQGGMTGYNGSDFSLISATSSQGTCNQVNYSITCNIGDIASNHSVTITLEIRLEYVGNLKIFNRVYADQFDKNYMDNLGLTAVYVSKENIEPYAELVSYRAHYPYNSNGDSFIPAVSADGRFVIFESVGKLIYGANGSNIYINDRLNKTIKIRGNGNIGRGYGGSYPSIANNGDLIVYHSTNPNIVENDDNNLSDIFALHRSTGETYRISVSNYGEEANKGSGSITDISADGRYVVFSSYADNLIPNDNNSKPDIFIHDTQTRKLSRINFEQSNLSHLRYLSQPSISGDGTFVAFTAMESPTINYSIYLWNRNTGLTKRISLAEIPDCEGCNRYYANGSQISDDGRYVVYYVNLNVYRYNIATEETELISIGMASEKGNGNSHEPTISSNGRFIAYTSSATNLVPNDTNGFYDIFVYDSTNKETKRVNIGLEGYQAKGTSLYPAISADGTTVVYRSIAHNLVLNDGKPYIDIFVAGNPFTTEPSKQVDLSIEKTASASEIEIGKNITYTLTVDNISVDPEAIATEVSVEDALPEGLAFISATPSLGTCSEDTGTVTCGLGDINVDDPSVTIEIVAKTTSKSEIKNTATVTAAETDSDTSNNSYEASITVIELTDVYINGSIDDTVTYYIGDELTYSFEVGNNSSNPATDVTATIDIPTGISISSAVTDTGICSVTGQKVTCILGNISTTNANITVKATPSTAADFDVAASVTTTKTDSDIDNNSDEVTITVEPKADLAISIADSDDPDDGSIYAGNDLTYTITVKNNGPSDATNVKIKDNLPTGVTFVSASSGCTEAAGEVICNIGDLANGASKSVNVVIKPTTPGTIINAVTVTATEFDPVAANDSAFEDTVVKAVADIEVISVSASPMPPSLVLTGNELTYTFKVKNNGINDATEVELKDTLPNGMEFVSAGSSPDCTETTGEVTCSIGDLANGANIDINIVVNPTKPGVFTNKANVSAKEYDPVDNNEKSIDVDVKAVTDMELVSASATPDPVYAGANLTYNVTIINNAAEFNTATGIKVTYTFSDTIVLDSASSCTAIGKVVTCYASDMAHNTSKNMQLVIQPDMDGDLEADIEVSSLTHDPDTSENSNSKSVTTTVTPAVDLVISMEEDIDPVLVGQDLTYTITVTNNGPSTATSVVLTDTLPGAAPVQSFVTSQGTCINNLTTFDCNIGDLANDDSVKITLVLRPTNGATGTLFNEATVSSGVYERPTTPDNNVASVSTTVNQSSKVKVSLKGKGSGTVNIDFNGTVTTCPGDCERTFTRGDSVTLTATADAVSTFNGWQGGVCKDSSDNSCTITLDKPNMNVMASFK